MSRKPWNCGTIETEVLELSKLEKLDSLGILGDAAPANIADLSKLQELKRLELNFSLNRTVRFDFLANMAKLRELSLFGADSINDVSFLRYLDNLRSLSLLGDAAPVQPWLDEVARPDKIAELMLGIREKNLHYTPFAHAFQPSACNVIRIFGVDRIGHSSRPPTLQSYATEKLRSRHEYAG